ncbi:hypothetical protein Sjap_011140 [Stephania japonica]|uniref:SNRNP25 ubiquitin-like domain-containing protein n=1 Tax=Stephania japonica TaxID=461633 RepID=A0AAP0JCY2_9MAGN
MSVELGRHLYRSFGRFPPSPTEIKLSLHYQLKLAETSSEVSVLFIRNLFRGVSSVRSTPGGKGIGVRVKTATVADLKEFVEHSFIQMLEDEDRSLICGALAAVVVVGSVRCIFEKAISSRTEDIFTIGLDVLTLETATVADLKEAVEHAFLQRLKKEDCSMICWSDVWSDFCLCFQGQKLNNNNDQILLFGIHDGCQIHLVQHQSINGRISTQNQTEISLGRSEDAVSVVEVKTAIKSPRFWRKLVSQRCISRNPNYNCSQSSISVLKTCQRHISPLPLHLCLISC